RLLCRGNYDGFGRLSRFLAQSHAFELRLEKYFADFVAKLETVVCYDTVVHRFLIGLAGGIRLALCWGANRAERRIRGFAA
ncbi:hypothetical protein, partial [Cypionkella sp.]|uniref:hypothetical protein n=1 Tax=Cypionkella sp. TaxID=2811411 RepID=UPI002AB9B24E